MNNGSVLREYESSMTPDAGHVNDGRKSAIKRMFSAERESVLNKLKTYITMHKKDTETCNNNGGTTEKRKREDDELPSLETKKFKGINFNKDSSSKPVESGIKNIQNDSNDINESVNDVQKPSIKGKASSAEEQVGKKKKKKTRHLEETPKNLFEAKYTQQQQIGVGGCGSVFAGYRNKDNLQVAIKHVQKDKVWCETSNGEDKVISLEVDVMLKLAAQKSDAPGASAPVALLDWYDLDEELILVLERPIPCQDLYEYKGGYEGSLPEDKAKVILKQLIEAAIDLDKKKIFHRDIKPQNILIETGSDFPRVRIIDFGVSCYFEENSTYCVFYGTPPHVPPEFAICSSYFAGPTTVWQIGVVLFQMLHPGQRFNTVDFLIDELEISEDLSEDCQDFFSLCLAEIPEDRPSVKELQKHSWFR